MKRQSDTLQQGDEKLARIGQVLQEVIAQRRAGQKIDYDLIERNHRDLMPQLGERLRRLRAVEAAADKARQRPASTNSATSGMGTFDETLDFLRGALTDYDVLEGIHYGGQGIVCRAIQRSAKREVAIKVLLGGPLATERQRLRFAREVELIARLRHPNIVTVYESGVVRGQHFFAMEFVDGLPIDDYVVLNDLDVPQTVRLFQIACQAVSAAHQQGVIHRDLKPANILVDADGQPQVLDFGLAKDLTDEMAAESGPTVSVAGHVVGTLPYLSPEQAGGAHEQVDVRSDIYTLGVVLFELLTGCFPYPVNDDHLTVRNNIVSHEPLILRKAYQTGASGRTSTDNMVNCDLERIVAKTLEKDKERRYQSAAALAADLGRYLTGDAVEARAASATYVLGKTLRKFRVHVTIGAAFLVILLASVVGMTVLWQRAETVAQIARTGMEMGSILKVGSVRRDEGRLDQAIELYLKSLEVGKYIVTSDPYVQRHRYGAHHRLAELYFQTDRPEEATPHCEAAIQIAEDMARDNPGDSEWDRKLAFSCVLRGRLAFSRSEWERALYQFDKAAGTFKDLLTTDPGSSSHRKNLAFALRWQGSCCQRLERFADSLQHCMAAYEHYRQLYVEEPEVVNYAVELAHTEIKMAVWHLVQETPDDDRVASQWFDRAEQRLNELCRLGKAQPQQWEITKLLNVIEGNRQEIIERAAKRAEN